MWCVIKFTRLDLLLLLLEGMIVRYRGVRVPDWLTGAEPEDSTPALWSTGRRESEPCDVTAPAPWLLSSSRLLESDPASSERRNAVGELSSLFCILSSSRDRIARPLVVVAAAMSPDVPSRWCVAVLALTALLTLAVSADAVADKIPLGECH